MLIIVLLVMIFALMFFISSCAGMALKIERQKALVLRLYLRGYWKAEGVSAYEACELWKNVRDEFDIPVGTATSIGVGDPYMATTKGQSL